MRRIGVLMNTRLDETQGQARVTALMHGLQKLGWTDGRNAPATALDAKIKSMFCEMRLEIVFDTAFGEAALAGLPMMVIVSPSTRPNSRKLFLNASMAP